MKVEGFGLMIIMISVLIGVVLTLDKIQAQKGRPINGNQFPVFEIR